MCNFQYSLRFSSQDLPGPEAGDTLWSLVCGECAVAGIPKPARKTTSMNGAHATYRR
jgi:hypothetical protein